LQREGTMIETGIVKNGEKGRVVDLQERLPEKIPD